MKKFFSKYAFWIIQICGWSLFMFLIRFVAAKKESNEEVLFDFLTGMITILMATGIVRWVLKKTRFNIIPFKVRDLLKLVFAILCGSILFYGLNELVRLIEESLFGEQAVKDEHWEKYGFLVFLFYAAIVLVWTAVYLVMTSLMQLNQQRIERLELKATLKEAQLNTLKGQVNPHFMFNSLNNIRGLMLEDVEKSRDMITKLSEMLEYALDKNTVDGISVNEELEMVENYIALSKIQMEDRLQFKKAIDPETLPILIPPMIIQLLVENAAKHGIANLKEGGTISLTIEKIFSEILIRVANTGTLKIAKDSTQLGVRNIRQRLHLLYGKKASFSLEEIADEVVAQIKIPLL